MSRDTFWHISVIIVELNHLVLDALINQCKDEVDNSMSRLVNAQLQHGGMLELGKDLEDAAEMYKSALENAKSCLENNETRIARIQVSESKSSCVNDDSKANDVEQDRMQNLVKRRHKWLSFLHRCYFYLGCVYNGLEKSDEEKMYYDEAANTRLRILTRAEERVCIMECKELQAMTLISIEQKSVG